MSAMPCEHRILWCPANQRPSESQLGVFVLYTGVRRTLAALRRAASLADGLNARIEVVLAQVVPYPLPIDEPQVPPSFLMKRLKTLVENAEVEASIRVYLCRDPREALALALPPRSVIVIGERHRWWRTKERRLGLWLKDRGHLVLFVKREQPRYDWQLHAEP